MAGGQVFASIEDALRWLNAGGHGIQSTTVELEVDGRFYTFRNYADGLFRKNSWVKA